MSRKSKLSLEQKVLIVLEGLKGEISISELCRKYGITTVYYYKLRDRFFQGGKRFLNGDKDGEEVKNLKLQIQQQKEIIGDLTIEKEILKKIVK